VLYSIYFSNKNTTALLLSHYYQVRRKKHGFGYINKKMSSRRKASRTAPRRLVSREEQLELWEGERERLREAMHLFHEQEMKHFAPQFQPEEVEINEEMTDGSEEDEQSQDEGKSNNFLQRRVSPTYQTWQTDQCQYFGTVDDNNNNNNTNNRITAEQRRQRCQQEANYYPHYCFQHGPQVYGYYVAPSTIAGAGLGLFTSLALDAGDIVVLYNGDLLLPHEYQARYPDPTASHYCLALNPQMFQLQNNLPELMVDARGTQSGLGRYINDPHNVPGKAPNVQFARAQGPNNVFVPVIVATRAIEPGEELLISYGGNTYWQGGQPPQ
jgi:hypothetical protein